MFDELRVIQHQFGYLPAEQLQRLSRKLNTPISEIHAVVSFFPHFHTSPRPKADVQVCCDMSCHRRRRRTRLRQSLDQAFRGVNSDQVKIRPDLLSRPLRHRAGLCRE